MLPSNIVYAIVSEDHIMHNAVFVTRKLKQYHFHNAPARADHIQLHVTPSLSNEQAILSHIGLRSAQLLRSQSNTLRLLFHQLLRLIKAECCGVVSLLSIDSD